MLSAYILSEFTIVCHLLTSLPVSSYLQKRDDLATSFLVDSPHIHKAVVLSPPQRTALRCKEYCGLEFFSAPHYNNTNRAEVKGGKYKQAIYFPPRLSLLVL